jgi:DNA-binding NtrC family response regulator
MTTQVRLLRALQQGEIRPVGSNEPRQINVRVIAATNRDLLKEVHEGRFREDLYYRLNVVTIRLPPLRARLDDVPALVRHFIEKHAAKLDKPVKGIEPEALEWISRHPWPGNVRELENALERAVILCGGDTITTNSLPSAVVGQEGLLAPAPDAFKPRHLVEVEREHIRRTLESTGWQVEGKGGAALLLGMKPTTLRSRMQKLGVRRPR